MAVEPQTPTNQESPLSAPARALLTGGTIAVLVAFYLMVAVALLGLVAYTAVVGILLISLIFSGWFVGRLAGELFQQIALILLILRTLIIGKEVECNLPLPREHAPRLFEMIEEVARAVQVPVPDEVRLEADLNASVLLHGYGKGRGHCRLTLGLDLLTALPAAEVRAVIAHEMAHARFVQRGLLWGLRKGLIRMCLLATLLQVLVESANQEKSWFVTARLLRGVFRLFASAGSRMIARLSRQDEFDADLAAVQVCGVPTYATALARSHLCGGKSGALSWRDRVLAHQQDHAYCAWLREQLSDGTEAGPVALSEIAAEKPDPLSFHPSLADRLAVLPGIVPATLKPFERCGGEELLAHPDTTAEQLLERYEQVASDQEQKESRKLLASVRERHRSTNPGRFQSGGRWLIAIAVLSWLVMIIARFSYDFWTVSRNWCFPLIAMALGLFVAARKRDTEFLPFFSPVDVQEVLRRREEFRREYRPLAPHSCPRWPATARGWITVILAVLLGAGAAVVGGAKGWDWLIIPGLAAAVAGLAVGANMQFYRKFVWTLAPGDVGLLASVAGELRHALGILPASERIARAETEAQTAFVRCDFLRALTAARLCLELDQRNRSARIIHAVSSAYFGDAQEAKRSLDPLFRGESLTPTMLRALGWIALFDQDPAFSEGYFLYLTGECPGLAEAWRSLAFAQRYNEHRRQAVRSARRALELDPTAADSSVLLARLLLDVARARQAEEILEAIPDAARSRLTFRLEQYRAALLRRRTEVAAGALQEIERHRHVPGLELEIVRCLIEADQKEEAEVRLVGALTVGHNPDAYLMLGYLATRRSDREAAAQHVTAALDLTRWPVPGASSALEILASVFALLRDQEEPVQPCVNWRAVLDLGEGRPDRYLHVAICDPDREAALNRAHWLCSALLPPWPPERVLVEFRRAPDEQQVVGPLYPGFHQFAINDRRA